MTAAWYCRRATWGRTWQSMVVVTVLCGLLGAAALAALAGARRTESAYGRYLRATNASDVFVNVPSPDTSLIAKVAALPGVRSSAAWLGLDANPVVHGHVDDSFVTDGFAGSVNGELFTQDTMTVEAGRLPSLRSTDEIALTPGLARLFGVGVGGRVTYQFENALAPTFAATGYRTYRVAAIVDLPPVLVDQFDQVTSAVLPPAATAATERLPNPIAFSWVGLRLTRGSTGVPALQAGVAHLERQVGDGYVFAVRQLDTVHQQVQEAIRPQAVALAVFGAFALLALLVLIGQALVQMLARSATQSGALRAMGLTTAQTALACGLGGAMAIGAGVAVAVVGAFALSPLAPVGPVRAVDPARGFQFDTTVVLGGGLVLLALLLAMLAWLAWRAVSPARAVASTRPSLTSRMAASSGWALGAALGVGYALDATPGTRRAGVRSNLVGGVIAVAAVVTAVIFGSSLNGLVTHPQQYGWNWAALIQNQGGYGSFLPMSVNAATLGDGESALDQEMARVHGVRGWSTFGFTQLPIDGQVVPVLGLATHGEAVEPPTVTGTMLTDTQAIRIGSGRGPSEIELGALTMQQLGKRIGDTVFVGTGPTARRLTVVGTVTLPSIGVTLSDHVSLGRGAMLPESTLLSIEDLGALNAAPAEAFSALPSTLAIDVDAHTDLAPVVNQIVSADPGGVPGGIYQVPQVRAAAIVDAGQMGSQPIVLAIAVAVAVLLSLSATVVAATRRRRRELAVLKALGMTRGQLGSVVTWQAMTILAIAIVVGIPVGLAVGRVLWSRFAASLGVVPVVVAPVLLLFVGTLVLLLAGAVLAAAPALLAARTPTTMALRAE